MTLQKVSLEEKLILKSSIRTNNVNEKVSGSAKIMEVGFL